jgi:hypothetical protein
MASSIPTLAFAGSTADGPIAKEGKRTSRTFTGPDRGITPSSILAMSAIAKLRRSLAPVDDRRVSKRAEKFFAHRS